MKMEQTECSETSAYKIQTPGNYPEESIHVLNFMLFIPRILITNLQQSTNKIYKISHLNRFERYGIFHPFHIIMNV